MLIKVKKLEHFKDLPLPKHQTAGSAGMDLYAAIDADITLKAMEVAVIPTGLAFEIPIGSMAHIQPRSSLSKKGILVHLGLCDEDFVGEYKITIQNLTGADFIIHRGDRIAQVVISQYIHCEIEVVNELKTTARGTSGWGSTGLK